MNQLIDSLESYLEETLGLNISSSDWDGKKRLAFILKNNYDFFEGRIGRESCLFIVDLKAEEQTPATINKHIHQIEKKYDGPVVYIRENITGYNRQRLIEHKVPFVVPGNQMYLPPLGIDLREYFKATRQELDKLLPASQALIVFALNSTVPEKCSNVGLSFSTTDTAEKLGYSRMTMSRAFREIDGVGLGTYYDGRAKTSSKNKEPHLELPPKKKLWEQALPLMQSPVKKRFYAQIEEHTGVAAELSALTRFSMIAGPKNDVVAMSAAEWKVLRNDGRANEVKVKEPGVFEVEIWSYDPRLFAHDGAVDKLSLYLSLKDNDDERVQMALDEMMENYKW